MLDSPYSNNPVNFQINKGATVYDVIGDKVGTVEGYDAQGGYMDVRKGWLFHKDVFVPTSAINTTDDDGIYLKVSKDELSDQIYDVAPGSGSPDMETTTETSSGVSGNMQGGFANADQARES
jgi:hypothetical protein